MRPDFESPEQDPAKEDYVSNNYDLELKEIQLQNEKLFREITELRKVVETKDPESKEKKAYYNVEECARMKGAAAILTYKGNRFMLPGCGNPRFSVHILGRLAFPAQYVERWLSIPDEEYLNYARECGVTAIPEKYKKLLKGE